MAVDISEKPVNLSGKYQVFFYFVLIYSFFAGSILSVKDLGALLSYTVKKRKCVFPVLLFILSHVPQSNFLFPLDGYR